MKKKGKKDGPLAGIRVLDLADEKASFCSKLFADMGACVIKIEKPGGDRSRRVGPFRKNTPNPDNSLFFLYNNTNKLGATINLEHGSGREIFRRLIKSADIVVETFSPGYLKDLGLSFEVLSEINPGLIMVSVTGFGQNGPRRDYKSCDLIASAYGGQMYVSGSPSDPPLKPFGEQSYYTASLFAAVGVMLALRRRGQSGKGEHIDISLQEAVASTLEHVMVRYFFEQIISKRQGTLHWNNSFFISPCKDGYILMTPFHQWETLVEWMAGEGMAEDLIDPKWREEELRLKNLDHIIAIMKRWTKTHTTAELFELGQLMRFPWAPVCSPKEVFNSPQLGARGFFIDVNHPEVGTTMKYPALPYRFNRYSFNKSKRAPLTGEDNDHLYKGELGLSDKEIKRLSSIKAI